MDFINCVDPRLSAVPSLDFPICERLPVICQVPMNFPRRGGRTWLSVLLPRFFPGLGFDFPAAARTRIIHGGSWGTVPIFVRRKWDCPLGKCLREPNDVHHPEQDETERQRIRLHRRAVSLGAVEAAVVAGPPARRDRQEHGQGIARRRGDRRAVGRRRRRERPADFRRGPAAQTQRLRQSHRVVCAAVRRQRMHQRLPILRLPPVQPRGGPPDAFAGRPSRPGRGPGKPRPQADHPRLRRAPVVYAPRTWPIASGRSMRSRSAAARFAG